MNLPIGGKRITRVGKETIRKYTVGAEKWNASIAVALASLLAEALLVIENLCLEFFLDLLVGCLLSVVWLQHGPLDLLQWHVIFLVKILHWNNIISEMEDFEVQ